MGGAGWAAVASALARLAHLTRLNDVSLGGAKVDLSNKEQGMALEVTAGLLVPCFASRLQDLDFRCCLSQHTHTHTHPLSNTHSTAHVVEY